MTDMTEWLVEFLWGVFWTAAGAALFVIGGILFVYGLTLIFDI